jgi:hypothetical protein
MYQATLLWRNTTPLQPMPDGSSVFPMHSEGGRQMVATTPFVKEWVAPRRCRSSRHVCLPKELYPEPSDDSLQMSTAKDEASKPPNSSSINMSHYGHDEAAYLEPPGDIFYVCNILKNMTLFCNISI